MKKIFPLFILSTLALIGCNKTSSAVLGDENNFDEDIIAEVSDDGTPNSYDDGYSSEEDVEIPSSYDSFTDGIISAPGKYLISGEQSAPIWISAAKNSVIYIFLDSASISSNAGIAFGSDKAIVLYLVLLNGSTSTITNDFADKNAFHVKGDVHLQGDGVLTVESKQEHGFKVGKNFFIKDVTLNAKGAKHAITAGTITSDNATINVEAGKDGIQLECDDKITAFTKEDGFAYLVNTKFTAETTGDGIQADTYIYINGGTYNIKTTGEFVSYSSENMSAYELSTDDFKYIYSSGEYVRVAKDEIHSLSSNYYALKNSVKGLKAGIIEYDSNDDDVDDAEVTEGEYDIFIAHGASLNIDSTDDCIHTNYGDVTLKSSNFVLSTSDDGVHADYDLAVDNVSIQISKSYEGLEGSNVTVDGSATNIVTNSSDDGINAANDDVSGDKTITINDGYIRVFANGDGLDANTALYLKGGIVIVEGPGSGNGSLDADNIYFQGGIVFACSTSGMTENMYAYQCTFAYQGSTMSSGKKISITDADNNVLFSYTLKQSCNQLIFSHPDMVKNSKYSIYSESSLITTITLTSDLTKVGISSGGGPGGGGGPGWY